MTSYLFTGWKGTIGSFTSYYAKDTQSLIRTKAEKFYLLHKWCPIFILKWPKGFITILNVFNLYLEQKPNGFIY